MDKKISILRLNILIWLLLWSLAGIYGVLDSFKIGGLLFGLLFAILSILMLLLVFKKYNPFIKECRTDSSFVLCQNKYIFPGEVIKSYEVNLLEKSLFIIKSPDFDYTTQFMKNGLLLKTNFDSYLIDNADGVLTHVKKSRLAENKKTHVIVFYLLVFLPITAIAYLQYIGVDAIFNAAAIMAFIYVIILQLVPPFYLGRKIDVLTLPLSIDEVKKFKNITIIEGFALSDRLSVNPFKKAVHLDGLAIDIIFKKFIILNPRLFTMGSKDYLKFVLFHELSHIEHHDSSSVVMFCGSIGLLDLTISLLPKSVYMLIQERLPYYDYILGGITLLYLAIVLIRRKKVELRADKSGIEAIGPEGVARVYRDGGIDLIKRHLI